MLFRAVRAAILRDAAKWPLLRMTVPVGRGARRDDNMEFLFKAASLAIFAVGEAGFFEVEIALDMSPDFVGDLAVAQQRVDEFSFLTDQFPRQIYSRCRHVIDLGIERVR